MRDREELLRAEFVQECRSHGCRLSTPALSIWYDYLQAGATRGKEQSIRYRHFYPEGVYKEDVPRLLKAWSGLEELTDGEVVTDYGYLAIPLDEDEATGDEFEDILMGTLLSLEVRGALLGSGMMHLIMSDFI